MLGKIEGRRRRGHQRMKCLEGITDKMDMNLGKLQGMVRDREAWHAAIYGAQRVGHNWETEQQHSLGKPHYLKDGLWILQIGSVFFPILVHV